MQAISSRGSESAADSREDELFLWTDDEGRIVKVNASDPRDLYRMADELIGKLLVAVPDADVSRTFQEALDTLDRTGQVVSVAYELPIGGERLPYRAQMIPQLDGGVCAVIRRTPGRPATSPERDVSTDREGGTEPGRGTKSWAVLFTLAPRERLAAVEVVRYLKDHGAEVEATYGTTVGGLVGTLVLFRAGRSAMQRISETCQASLPALHASCHPTEEPRPGDTVGDAYVLTIFSFDKEGQLIETARVLEELGATVLGLAGCTYSAQEVGAPLFVVEMLLGLRPGASFTRLSAGLDELADRLGWDIDLRPERRRAGGRVPYPPLRAVRREGADPEEGPAPEASGT